LPIILDNANFDKNLNKRYKDKMTPKWHPSVFGNQPRFFEFEEVKELKASVPV